MGKKRTKNKNAGGIISLNEITYFSFPESQHSVVDRREPAFGMMLTTLPSPGCFCHMGICLTSMADLVNGTQIPLLPLSLLAVFLLQEAAKIYSSSA